MSKLVLPLVFLAACGTANGTSKEEKAMAIVEEQAKAPVVAEADDQGWAHYGEAFTTDEIVASSDLFADPNAFVGKTIRVQGRIADVCQQAGCWMVIAEGDKTMRVMMKDHAFAVAKDITGQDCMIEGTVSVNELDADTVKHLEGESKNPEAMPEKQAVDNKVYEFTATGVASRKG